MELGDIPQESKEIQFAVKDLEEGCRNGLYENVTKAHSMETKASCSVISLAFTVWQEKLGKIKGLFVINFALQSTYWARGS